MNVILASNSPRRKELLEKAGVNFTVIPPLFKEPSNCGLTPEKYVEFLAKSKAESIFKIHGNVVIGADTVVVFNDQIFGKPKDENQAIEMLEKLSNNTHKVITGYAVISDKKIVSGYEVTFVTFNNLSKDLIRAYVKTGSPLDKAGAYGIQDNDYLVKKIDGDYDNVVGLPTNKIINILSEFI